MNNPYADDPQEPQWNPYQGPMAPMGQPGYAPPGPPSKGNGLAVTSMVLGIVSLVLMPMFCCWPIGFASFVLAVTGEVLGWVAYVNAKKGRSDGEGLALTGIITSAVTLAIYGAMILYFIGMMLVQAVSG